MYDQTEYAVACAAGLGAAVAMVKCAADFYAEGKDKLAAALIDRLPTDHRDLLAEFQNAGAALAGTRAWAGTRAMAA